MEIARDVVHQLDEFLHGEGCTTSVKMLDKKLGEMGDLLIKSKTDTVVHFDVELLQRISATWPLQVARVSFAGNVAHIWFDRVAAFRTAISSMEWKAPLKHHSNRSSQPHHLYVDVPVVKGGDGALSMTQFRANTVGNFTRKCFTHAGYPMVDDQDELEQLHKTAPVCRIMFVQKKNKMASEPEDDATLGEQRIEILSGPVLTGSDLADANDYIKHRANEMQLIAQHRYGVRIHDIDEMNRIVASLGRSAAIIDVLQQKHCSTIDMRAVGLGGKLGNTRTPTATKGAAFILYNFARLRSIFKKYRHRIEREGYPRIPPVGEVDFSLLTEPDEWQLAYVYVIGFPAALRRTLGDGQLDRLAPHHLLEFTFGLVSCLSKYYRSTRILTDNRPKLLPVMVARLHLLEAIYEVLQTLLNLLDLEPIEEM